MSLVSENSLPPWWPLPAGDSSENQKALPSQHTSVSCDDYTLVLREERRPRPTLCPAVGKHSPSRALLGLEILVLSARLFLFLWELDSDPRKLGWETGAALLENGQK